MDYIPDPLPPSLGLEAEDNYQILVYDRKGGNLLGIALRTSMGGIVHDAFRQAVEQYPGRHLVEANGRWLLRAVTAPTGKPDQFGWIDAGDACLADLPQWFGLVGRCDCGYMALIDRYDPRVTKWRLYPLRELGGKVPCPECKRRRNTRGKVDIGLRKLPR